MRNQELAKIFYGIADYLKMDNVAFRPYAYDRAAMSLEGLEEDIKDIYERDGLKGLEEIPGVGENIALKIEEYLKTGIVGTYERLKKKTPVNLGELTSVEGMGVKKAKILYEKLKIKNLKDLEKAVKAHKVAGLEGFGEKSEKNISEGIAFVKRNRGRFLLGEIMPIVENILEELNSLKEVEKISVAGSVRRMKETIGDVDVLVVSKNPKKVMDFFVTLDGVVKVWSKGTTRSSIRMSKGFDVDLRVVPARSYGSALQYFTGSKDHNIVTRKIAMSKKLKLNEYGLFKGSKMIAGKNEKDIYKAIGLDFIPPELRENRGEVSNKLPNLIDYDDIKGDFHCHSNWDGGKNSIKQIALKAKDLGYKYIGISDHTKFLKIEHGLNEKQLAKQRKEIDKLDLGIKILQGCEANILKDGSIDIKDEALAKLDFVIAGVHSSMKMSKEEMTERIIKAMRNKHVDIISHPTGRVLNYRDEYQVDFDRILKEAKNTNTILEINASPYRLDLKDINIKKAKDLGVKMIINTDAHHIDQMELMKYGVAQARRGWAEKKDIINTFSLSELLKWFL
jgi:DNA polymerase (family 10)